MYFSNGFVYGGTPVEMMKVTKVKPLDNMMLLLTFNSGEQRLYCFLPPQKENMSA